MDRVPLGQDQAMRPDPTQALVDGGWQWAGLAGLENTQENTKKEETYHSWGSLALLSLSYQQQLGPEKFKTEIQTSSMSPLLAFTSIPSIG